MGRTAPRTGVGSVHRFADVRSLERTGGSLSGSLGCWAHAQPAGRTPRGRIPIRSGPGAGVVTACVTHGVTGIFVRVQRSRCRRETRSTCAPFLERRSLDLRDSFTRRGGAARPIHVLNPGLAHTHTAFIGRALFLSLRSSQKHCAGDRRVTGM